MVTDFFVTWLIESGVGPALAAIPVNLAAEALARAAHAWFGRFRRTDDLSRLVKAATGTFVDLTHSEFDAVRRLLEDQQTWRLLGQATVEDLAAHIASCLPARDGRTAEDSRAAAVTITRGLLEFAVADLNPKVFQQLLMARLQRLETNQASALDAALVGLNADIAARLAMAGEFDARRFTSVVEHLKRVLNRLPPSPADRGELVVYLQTLIDWLNSDPWPRDRRFGGPVLTPAAIERKLRVAATDPADKQYFDADMLAQQCQRLVVLGGPGSGKTWLARRTARSCAESALQALTAGRNLDEVELPLYTTCSRLFSADGDIREAAVSSALGQIGDLGGSRVSTALRMFFTERNAPTVLVIDSLDEARGSGERLRQADTLPWRIVLTSRPSSWNHQMVIGGKNDSHRVGELQSLRYPDDVEPFIQRWFAQRPEWGTDLATQIARRPGLQRAATVPLILAFYCIVGGGEPLPDFRRDLYSRVLKRMLTGGWRGIDAVQPNVDTCLQTLRAWAWSGATSHAVSGVGAWTDDVPTESNALPSADQDALDHIATPLGPPDVDTGTILRRFIHRSIQEHLVAEHIAMLPATEAAGTLLPHIWYDPDWEYTAPAALVMHPEHDDILRALICRAAQADTLPPDISAIDADGQFKRFLTRVASESSEASWSPEITAIIHQARIDLATDSTIPEIDPAPHWETSNRQACEKVLRLLRDAADIGTVQRLAEALLRFNPSAADERQARDKVLRLFMATDFGASLLGKTLVQLDPSAEEQRQAREQTLRVLGRATGNGEVESLAGVLLQLAPPAQDRRQARNKLLKIFTSGMASWATRGPAGTLVSLAVTAEERRDTREQLLGLLAQEADADAAGWLVKAVANLDPTAKDRHQARDRLLAILASGTGGWAAERLAGTLVSLAVTAEERRNALEVLASQSNGWSAGATPLQPSVHERRQDAERLLALLASETNSEVAARQAEALTGLAPTAQNLRQARQKVLELLIAETDVLRAWGLGDILTRLNPTARDRDEARHRLLKWLNEDRDLKWLNEEASDLEIATGLAETVASLAVTPEERRYAREKLLELIAHEADWDITESLLRVAISQAVTTEDRREIVDSLLRLLAWKTDSDEIWLLMDTMAKLDPTAEDQRIARERLLGLLATEGDCMASWGLAQTLAGLAPTADDLATSHAWANAPPTELLREIRKNSPTSSWLAVLPSLAGLRWTLRIV